MKGMAAQSAEEGGAACDASAESSFEVVEDRASAIRRAVAMASPRDIVLIAGKGHEDYQESAEGRIHFDDREEAEKALRIRMEGEGAEA